MLKWHGPGVLKTCSRPFQFPRLWFSSRTSSCQGEGPGAIPGSRTSARPRASMRSRVSKTQPARGSTEAACQLKIRSPKSEVRRNTEIPIAKPEAVGVLDRASRCRSSQAVASGDSDLELRACFGLRDSNFGFHVGSWQTSNAPALQAGPCGSVTRRLHHFYCGENEIQVSLISSTFVGATPTPATTFREVSRLPGRNPGVTKQAGSDDWSVTSTSHHLDP